MLSRIFLNFVLLIFITSSSYAEVPIYKRVSSESEFRSLFVGKLILHRESRVRSFTISSDGTWGGTWNGKKIGGTWRFVDGDWCRIMTGVGEDCQEWEIDQTGKKIKVTRNRGMGEDFRYTIE
ncbi:hypothetical protein HAT86_15655 [Roseovarius gahaiensis]|uniref:Dihydrodipicolinate reductase n=1 Tax=Roseovarius gahaiensis TaxID=2716691 RepID=A0A967BD81_9RHOB|nr:hypothetical protein [Roseovarius gahaiensis]NHQ75885.1 hypothetical protein [Roseovarius gahaiensis]